MNRWESVVVSAVAGAFVAGTVFAQAATPTPPSDKPPMAERARGGASAMGTPSERVKAAQQALKDKGHDPGSVDGVMGPKTRQALKDFQKAQGIKETGRLDAETLAKLGVASRTGAADGAGAASASPRTDASPDQPKK